MILLMVLMIVIINIIITMIIIITQLITMCTVESGRGRGAATARTDRQTGHLEIPTIGGCPYFKGG